MAIQITIKRPYIQAASDIFQVVDIKNQILNEKQVATLVNLNVLDKWCIKRDMDVIIREGDYVICIPTENPRTNGGTGHVTDLVFPVASITRFGNEDILYGGYRGHGVLSRYVRKLTPEEIDRYLAPDLPF